MAEGRRDQNMVVTLMGVTDDGNLTPINLVVDPTTGRLKVSAVISSGDAFVEKAGDTMTGDLILASSDIENGTTRLYLSSYERAVYPNHYGENIRIDWKAEDAKATIAFRDETGASKAWLVAHEYLFYTNPTYTKTFATTDVNATTDVITLTGHGWTTGDFVKLWSSASLPTGIAHLTQYAIRAIDANTIALYRSAANASADTNRINFTTTGSGTHSIANYTDGVSGVGNHPHRHFSIETADSTGAVQTRMEFPWGQDSPKIKMSNVVLADSTPLYIIGENGGFKDIRFGLDETDVYQRFALRLNNTTESGSQVGSDFQIVRFDDTGSALDAPFTVKRSSGFIGLGTSSPTDILSLGGNSLRKIRTERHTTANTAGNRLNLEVGGATSGATDKDGGELRLVSGIATGTGTSFTTIYTAAAGGTGTTDRTPTEKLRVTGAGDVGIGTTTPGSKLDIAGSFQCDSITNDTGLAAGTYTPTRSAEANLDSSVTMLQAQYMRVGNTVTVSGRFTADPTLTATTTSFEIDLPIASDLGAAEDVAGVAFCGSIAAQGAEVIGVAANNTAKIQWKSADVTSQTWSFTFTYQVI